MARLINGRRAGRGHRSQSDFHLSILNTMNVLGLAMGALKQYIERAEMTPPDDGNMHQQIGMLTAKVDMMLEAQRRSEEKSDVSRASVHRRMDEMVDRVSKVETTMVTVQEDISEMRPVTDDVRRWKLMGLGALGVIGIGGMAMGVTFADAIRRVGAVIVGR